MAMTPVMTMARGMSRSGFRISSAIVDASSMPMKAKHITPRPLAMSSAEPATIGGVAATPCHRATAAAMTSSPTVTALPTPPALLIHLPTPMPRTLATVMMRQPPERDGRRRTTGCPPARAVRSPPANATTPAR